MKPVFDYQSYREFILDYYRERKRCSSFTWRGFAALAGFASGSYLKLVCDGKTRLSPQGAEKVGMAMALAGFELEYFKSMVTYCHAKTDQERKIAYEAMLELASNNKVKIVDGDAFKYFQSWVHPVVRELAPVMPGATPSDIARRCCQGVSAAEVRESLEFMVRVGLLKKNGDTYEQADKHLKGLTSAVSLALRYMHREMAHFAEESINRFAPSERNFTGLTMGISAEDYNKILQELDVCRKKVAQIALNSHGTERVYRLNLQLFPLTWKEDKSNAQ